MKTYIIIGILIIVIALLIIFKKQVDAFLSHQDVIDSIKKWCVAADTYIRGSKLGQERLAYVCGKLVAIMPAPLQFFVTAEKLKAAVNAVFDEIKITLEDGSTVAGE